MSAGPSAGWYDDPGRPGTIRWWDGESWTEHTQVKPGAEPEPDSELGPEPARRPEAEPAQTRPASAAGPTDAEIEAMLRGAAAGPAEDPGLRRALPIVLVGLVILLALLATAVYLSSRAEDEPGSAAVSVASEDEVSADTDAQALVKTAQTAIETYGSEHGGSFEGATDADLAQIEPSLSGAQLSVDTDANSYTVSVTSAATGNAFTITRDSAGTVSLTCAQPGVAGCPAGGRWG